MSNNSEIEFAPIIGTDELRLIRLCSEHYTELAVLAADERIWQHASRAYADPDVFREQWFEKALQHIQVGRRQAYAIECNGELIGSTSFYAIDAKNKKCNIGYTWLSSKVWGSGVNRKVKMLMFDYIFRQLGFNRVAFSIDKVNQRSQAAVRKLGLQEEGTLRSDMILADRRVRDSVIFSLIRSEWEALQAG